MPPKTGLQRAGCSPASRPRARRVGPLGARSDHRAPPRRLPPTLLTRTLLRRAAGMPLRAPQTLLQASLRVRASSAPSSPGQVYWGTTPSKDQALARLRFKPAAKRCAPTASCICLQPLTVLVCARFVFSVPASPSMHAAEQRSCGKRCAAAAVHQHYAAPAPEPPPAWGEAPPLAADGRKQGARLHPRASANNAAPPQERGGCSPASWQSTSPAPRIEAQPGANSGHAAQHAAQLGRRVIT